MIHRAKDELKRYLHFKEEFWSQKVVFIGSHEVIETKNSFTI